MTAMLSWGIIYLLDLVKLIYIMFGGLRLKRRKPWLVIIGATIAGEAAVFTAIVFIRNGPGFMVAYWVALLAVMMIYVADGKKLLVMVPIFLLINVSDSLLSSVVQFVVGRAFRLYLTPSYYYLIVNIYAFLMDICIISLILWIIRRRQAKRMPDISSYYIGIISLGLLLILIMLTIIQPELNSSDSLLIRIYGTAGPLLIFVVFAVVCITAMHISTKNIRYQEQIRMNEKMLVWQKQYYQSMLDREIETQTFRHDMSHHMYFIEQLVDKGQNDAIKDYLMRLQDTMERLKVHIETGSDVLNIIVRDVFSHPQAAGIELKWKGCFPENTRLVPMDLCVLFSNILSNAVTAAAQCPEGIKKQVQVTVKTTEHHLYIKVLNPAAAPVQIHHNQLETTKEKPEEHGFGTWNATEIVEHYGGDIQFHYEDAQFMCEIFFTNIFET